MRWLGLLLLAFTEDDLWSAMRALDADLTIGWSAAFHVRRHCAIAAELRAELVKGESVRAVACRRRDGAWTCRETDDAACP